LKNSETLIFNQIIDHIFKKDLIQVDLPDDLDSLEPFIIKMKIKNLLGVNNDKKTKIQRKRHRKRNPYLSE
jgi:hypothetical protein